MTLARSVLLSVALVTVLGGLWLAPQTPEPERFGFAVATVAIARLLQVRFRVGAGVITLLWGEAALIIGLYLVPAGWLPLAFAVGVLVSVGLRWLARRDLPSAPVHQVVASLSIAAGVGGGISAALVDPHASRLTPATAAGLTLGAVGYLLVTSATVSVLAGIRDRINVPRLVLRTLLRKLPMFVGNVAVGLMVVALTDADWRLLLGLPLLLWLLQRTYAQRLQASENRRMWNAFARAARSLNQGDEQAVTAAGVRGALEVFSVGRAEVELVPAADVAHSGWHGNPGGSGQGPTGPGQTGSDRPGSGRDPVDGWNGERRSTPLDSRRRLWVGDHTGVVQQRPVEPDGVAPSGQSNSRRGRSFTRNTAVALMVGEDEIGQLRVYFPKGAGPGDGDLAALQAYGDALAAALHNTATHQELHQLLARSAHDAQHDPLTGLLNRASLLARGETAVQLVPHADPVALLLVDVNHFREINDTLGHAAGDEVLRVAATRLQAAARPGELVARLGGDEFALLVTESPSGPGLAGRRALRRGRELVDKLAEPATISGVPVSIEVSVGVVVVPAGTADLTELLRRADAAMHLAKDGGGAVGWYDDATDPGGTDRLALLAELRGALARDDELVLVLQPVVDLPTGAPAAVEALARWRHPRRGLLTPSDFLRAVENSDLLGAFTEYVLDQALAAAARWARLGPAVPVAVNLSPRSLLDPGLPKTVGALLRKHKVRGRRLILEITETVMTRETPGLDEVLTGLRSLGVRLAVDDFGTGYASLTFLTRVPLDVVKVDGALVRRMAESVEAAAIVRTTIGLGRELGLRVVAEGVETASQRQQLTTLGCSAAQGYHFAEPVPVERIGAALQALESASTRARVIPLRSAGRPAVDRPAPVDDGEARWEGGEPAG